MRRFIIINNLTSFQARLYIRKYFILAITIQMLTPTLVTVTYHASVFLTGEDMNDGDIVDFLSTDMQL